MWNYLERLVRQVEADGIIAFPADPRKCDRIRTPRADPVPDDYPIKTSKIKVDVGEGDVTTYYVGGVPFACAKLS